MSNPCLFPLFLLLVPHYKSDMVSDRGRRAGWPHHHASRHRASRMGWPLVRDRDTERGELLTCARTT